MTDGHAETKVDLKIGAEELVVRVITGTAFRNSEFMLDGIKKLMSAEGRGALADENIRDKAKAILGKVLDKSKGGFAFNIVYRLQAAVSELQKLGLELPPQINCFIQSLVRLSNTVTEMNTIMNQCKAMLDSANKMTCPVPERDELDLVGQQFDIFASEEGKLLVNGKPKYAIEAESARFGGSNADMATMFTEDGEFAKCEAGMLQMMKSTYQALPLFKLKNPNTFASALTDVLFDGFDALKGSLSAGDAFQLGKDAGNIAYNELGLGYVESFIPYKVLAKLEKDTKKIGGDKGYQVDIGV